MLGCEGTGACSRVAANAACVRAWYVWRCVFMVFVCGMHCGVDVWAVCVVCVCLDVLSWASVQGFPASSEGSQP